MRRVVRYGMAAARTTLVTAGKLSREASTDASARGGYVCSPIPLEDDSPRSTVVNRRNTVCMPPDARMADGRCPV